jgi:hypothetical protein
MILNKENEIFFQTFVHSRTKIHLGNDYITNDPKAGIEKYLQREYTEIFEKGAGVILVPDSFDYKGLAKEVN